MTDQLADFYFHLGRKVQRRRKALGMSQARLGALLVPPVQRASIANVEGGKQGVLVHTLAQIAQGLGVQPQDLLPIPAAESSSKNLRERIETELAEKLDLSRGKSKSLAESLLAAADSTKTRVLRKRRA